MKPGPLYERVVDVCEELMKFTLLTRERKERAPERLNSIAADVGFAKR
ncbi:arsenic resistance protein ArsH [Methylorubrum thiocyanatum]|uniref:Arsenical resistance protein ArsH n=2 Tax=Methylorubrum TaxID=2282523 RepID=A0A1I4E3H8_9HYPH|nr:arsenic resistance protein ArsH [Methylorubrum thiocyanatum]GJE82441.1 hypothetical protein CJNNKLLH_3806 [Methylorubrum thiocyanatum]SFK98906.1 arsenical resistance protein ArsH [Methylorubrum salsuginis]